MTRQEPSLLTTALVLSMGLTFPLFAVEYFRVGMGPLTLAAPVALCALLALSGVVRRFVAARLPASVDVRALTIGVLCLAFWTWHLVSALRAENLGWALRDLVKLTTGMFTLWAVTTFVPARRVLLERFWIGVIWTSTALLAYLIYQYAFVFRVPYLGSVLHEPSRASKNQLTWYLVFALPFALAYFRAGPGRKIVRLVPLVVLASALIYAASRSAILAVLLGTAWMSFTGRGVSGLRRVSSVVSFGLKTAVLALVCFQLLGLLLGGERLEIGRRVLALTNPEAVPESHSVDSRVALAEAAWESFAERPIDGIGLTNSGTFQGLITHNDYLGLLADTGSVGLGLFLVLLAALAVWLDVLPAPGSPAAHWWVTWGGRSAFVAVAFSLLFINAYPNAILWTFWGMARVATVAVDRGEAS